ncbi:hypothetical protein C818_00102 [Lachnospiraceae bacterium MD308]|nr:hypothetical protein C818_00102 [Lachnospiraceae bacterium MD308]
MGDLISVIVPVYNSEQYLCSCIESVLKQTYSAFEVLLIEDGSEDSSPEICEMLCQKDKRIRLVRQEHKGVSAARNLGIEVSQGKYLFFLDSDDLIHPQLLEALYQLQEENHTVLAAEGICYGTADDFLKAALLKTSIRGDDFYMDNKKALEYMNNPMLCGIGGKMISRTATDNVRFNETLGHGEDTLFVYQLLTKGGGVSVLQRDWYYYRRHEENASKEFSVKACRERYRIECYIRDHELQSKRKENAICREYNIIAGITEWYNKGRRCQNSNLMKYAKYLAKREKKLQIFRQLSWKTRLYFSLFLYCYPLSSVIFKIWKICEDYAGSRGRQTG